MRVTRLRVLLVLLAAAIAGALVILTSSIKPPAATPVTRLDKSVLVSLNEAVRQQPSVIFVWKVITTIGSPNVMYALIGVAAVFLAYRRRPRVALVAIVVTVGSWASSRLLKNVVNRPRPELATPVSHAGGASFPSGHALVSFVVMGVLLLLVMPTLFGSSYRRPATAAAIVVVALVGFSRLILGVHYLSDVIAGWLIGSLWLIAVVVIRHRLGLGTPLAKSPSAQRSDPSLVGGAAERNSSPETRDKRSFSIESVEKEPDPESES